MWKILFVLFLHIAGQCYAFWICCFLDHYSSVLRSRVKSDRVFHSNSVKPFWETFIQYNITMSFQFNSSQVLNPINMNNLSGPLMCWIPCSFQLQGSKSRFASSIKTTFYHMINYVNRYITKRQPKGFQPRKKVKNDKILDHCFRTIDKPNIHIIESNRKYFWDMMKSLIQI